jgi:hypothetical protein
VSGLNGKRSLQPYRETPEVVEAVCRLIRSVGKRVAQEDETSLVELVKLERTLAEAWAIAVAGLRADAVTDGQIGRVLGVTRQAVEQRWPR